MRYIAILLVGVAIMFGLAYKSRADYFDEQEKVCIQDHAAQAGEDRIRNMNSLEKYNLEKFGTLFSQPKTPSATQQCACVFNKLSDEVSLLSFLPKLGSVFPMKAPFSELVKRGGLACRSPV